MKSRWSYVRKNQIESFLSDQGSIALADNVHDKRVPQTSECPTPHYFTTTILNYTTTTLGNNNN